MEIGNQTNLLPKAIWFVPAAVLLLAMLPFPYAFYSLLRLVVCAAASYLAWTEYRRWGQARGWVLIFGLVALLFNPLIPVHLARAVWAVLDLAGAAIFLIHMRAERQRLGAS